MDIYTFRTQRAYFLLHNSFRHLRKQGDQKGYSIKAIGRLLATGGFLLPNSGHYSFAINDKQARHTLAQSGNFSGGMK